MLTKDIVKLAVLGDEITFRQYEENGEYEKIRSYIRVISVSMHHSEVEYLVFGLELKRKYSYYLVNIVLPVFFIQLLGIVVFAVPTDSGEKLTFSLTLLLSLTVMMTLIADKIPSTSLQIPMLSKYLLGGLVISSLELIVTVIILHFKHSKVKDVNMSRRMQAFANGLASITFNRKRGCTRQPKVLTTDSDIKPTLVFRRILTGESQIDIKPTLC
ncbi:acetylcholine receptor subunit beta-like [Ruditapes philippinarum]|uniref:acetylcholine receptor subunit beta-like n=1 Tax=Ruditapes philippinarum TaxID=129788 RepID=UPI00295C0E65|nr:acetylcholine receptor subunit beta-like [Ruditapes philippinarum]